MILLAKAIMLPCSAHALTSLARILQQWRSTSPCMVRDMGTLSIEATLDNGQNWLPVWQMIGQKHTDGEWEQVNVDLDEYAGKKVQFRLDYQVQGEKGDASFDSIQVDAVSQDKVHAVLSSDSVAEDGMSFTFTLQREGSVAGENLDSSSDPRSDCHGWHPL